MDETAAQNRMTNSITLQYLHWALIAAHAVEERTHGRDTKKVIITVDLERCSTTTRTEPNTFAQKKVTGKRDKKKRT